ncbi:DUF945 family protein [Candidatus Albibeggiatoa sp. nov. NOAA]|uniref:DUF945 family protein n=1 Tax=Candidatus Albibeggiatoa sp. nov. NOAA TaxID=3162724 RepID=UPI0032F35C65|nr:YdgA family protein [Thiotrichaceae bacterium]
MWKKWLFPTIVALVIAGLVIPYWVGLKAEHEFSVLKQTLPVVGEWHPVGANYERGWFQSQAQTTFRPEQLDQTYVTFNHDIQHSITPFQPTTINTTLQTDGETQSFLQYIFAGRSPFIMKTDIYLSSGTSYLQVAPFSMRQGEQAFIWQGLQGQINFGLNGEYLENQFVIPEFSLQTQYGKIELQGIQLNGQAKQNRQLYVGQLQLQVEKVATLSSGQSPMQLNKIQVIANNDLVDDYLNFAVHAQAQDLQVGQQVYQPHYFDAELKHIHEPTLMEWRNALQAYSSKSIAPTEWNFMQLSLLAKYGTALLNHQPEMSVSQFQIQTHAGKVSGKLSLQVTEDNGSSPANLMNPFAIINRLQADVSLSMPQEVIETTIQPQQKQWLLNNKLLIAGAEGYEMQLKLKNGFVDANGLSIPLMQLVLGQ